jgi:hypothetical protein
MSWEEDKDRRNMQALARLTKSLPTIFPPAVLDIEGMPDGWHLCVI